jgi:hypothetical protein
MLNFSTGDANRNRYKVTIFFSQQPTAHATEQIIMHRTKGGSLRKIHASLKPGLGILSPLMATIRPQMVNFSV